MKPSQPIWNKAKKVLKFIWRHLFTLVDLSLSIQVLIFHTLIWKNAFISLAIAITIDWAKQFMKFGRHVEVPSSMNDPFNIGTPFHKKHWSNPDIIGSTTNILNSSHQIKYD